MCRTLEVGRQIVKQRRLQAGLQIVEYEQHGNVIEEEDMLKTAMIFGDRMVLQREKPISVWGTSDPASCVEIDFDGSRVSTAAGPDGGWKAQLPPHAAAKDLTMVIRAGSEELVLRDVAVGEVWIAGGQSNMEYYLGFEKHYEEIAAAYESTDVRFFDYPEVAFEEEFSIRDYIHEGFWRNSTREDLAYFSAVAFYFARYLQNEIQVPVGIVGCNWGGTTASAWLGPKLLEGTPGDVWLEDYRKITGSADRSSILAQYLANPLSDSSNRLADPYNIRSVKIGFSREEQARAMEEFIETNDPSCFVHAGRPGGLYCTMLKKVAPYTARGVIWYQGESDGDAHPEVYTDVLTRMIGCWRDLWGDALPFLLVQLAPFDKWMQCVGDNYGIIRDCQEEVSRTVPGTWITTTGDVGMQWDIHPKNKLPVGERLALLALGHVYGRDILCDPPAAQSLRVEGDSVIITFRNADGLHISGDHLNALQLELENGDVVDAQNAAVSGNELIVSLAGIVETNSHGGAGTGSEDDRAGAGSEDDRAADAATAPGIAAVRFARENYYEVNLYNAAGIPALPFRMEITRS